MNRMLQAQLSRLQDNVRALARQHEGARAELEEERGVSLHRQKSILQHTQTIATMQLNEREYELLQKRVSALEENRTAMREHAQRMQALAQALGESLQR